MTVNAPNGSRTRALIRAAGMIAVVTILALSLIHISEPTRLL